MNLKSKKQIIICILKILLILIIIQLIRIGINKVVYNYVIPTNLIITIVSIIEYTVFSFIMYMYILKFKIKINMFNKEKKKLTIVGSAIIVLLILLNFFIFKNINLYYILNVIYSVVITPVFEETIFRGIVYEKIKEKSTDIFAYISSTIIFAIWHIGYVDTILLKTSINGLNFNMLDVMFWKVITGLVFGIIIGFVKYKTKSTYISILVHGMMNMFGK